MAARLCQKSSLALLLVALLSAAACKKSDAGTYVHVRFDGTVSQDKPIYSIQLDLQLGQERTSTSFTAPGGEITLPTDGALAIRSGAGVLQLWARALSKDGLVLGERSTTGNVVAGQTTTVDVFFSLPQGDAGADAISPDAAPASDASWKTSTGGSEGTDLSGGGGDPGLGGGPGGSGGAGGSTQASSGSFLLSLSLSTLDFGITRIGAVSNPQTLTVSNAGSSPTPPLVVGLTDKRFPRSQDGCAGKALAAGASCSIVFSFSPDVAGLIEASGGIGPDGGPWTKLKLIGTGASSSPTYTLAPASVDFKAVDVGGSATSDFTVTNNGPAEQGDLKIALDGPPSFQIKNDRCSNAALPANGQCSFTLVFSPTAVGAASATVYAKSVAGTSSSATVIAKGQDVVQLTIQFTGPGKGTVGGVSPACGSPGPCVVSIARTDPANPPKVLLTAQPDSGSQFGGWTGPCAGTGNCSLVMDGSRTVTAGFYTANTMQISLNVIGLAGQSGIIVSDDGSITCSTSCPNLSVPMSANLILLAKPGADSTFAGWSGGACRGTSPKCVLSAVDGMNVTATFAPQAYMFVSSSQIVPGKLGDPKIADEECERLASKAMLPGTYAAWLSTKDMAARWRIGKGGWLRTDGRPFAPSIDALVGSQVIYYPPRLDETGNDLGNAHNLVVTGGAADGTIAESQCAGFTSTVGEVSVGDTASSSFLWAKMQTDPDGCGRPYRIYCFRSDVGGAILPPPQPGRRMFVTAQPYVPAGGVSGADDVCQKEAANANLAGKFVAFLSTSTAPAMRRISPSGSPWKRVDEVSLVRQIQDFANGRLLATPNLTADGKLYADFKVWTGSKTPDVAGTDNCRDWTTPSDSLRAIVGASNTTASVDWFALGGGNGSVPCNDPNTHLLCVEP